MATQETASLRDKEITPKRERAAGSPQVALAVDQASPSGQGVLVLPFGSEEQDGALGRHLGLLLQHRLQQVPNLSVGVGRLLAVSQGTRRYLPLQRALSADQALACATSWKATAVLYGTIKLEPELQWEVILQEVPGGKILFEDILVGKPEELLDAPGTVAEVVVRALDLTLDEAQQTAMAQRETQSLPALRAYLQAVDLRPQHGLTLIDPDGVRSHLLRAVALDPAFSAPAVMLIADLQAASDTGTALANLIGNMETLGAEGATAGAVLAQRLEERGLTELAATLTLAVLEQEPTQELALTLAAQQAYRAGHFSRARLLVSSLLDVQSHSVAGHELQGNLLAAVGRYPGAAQHWEIALGLDPDRPKLLMRLGSYLAVTGEYGRAFELLRKATTLGSSTADSLYQLGVVAYRLGLTNEGIAALHRALQREPDRGTAHAMLARCYMREGRDDLALVHDDRAMELMPNHWPSALAVAHSALTRGQMAEAFDAYAQVARLRPDLAEALYGLGTALVASNRVDDGVVVLQRARELRSGDVSILCALSLAYLRARKFEDAARTVEEALDLAPESPQVARTIAILRQYRPRWSPNLGR